ncbi:MAG: hypothetical protein JNM58_02445 [Xanthomonadaceae bacterium]|nr:hypothetical protein [Xanthomonadaceae bacterium]
MTHRFAFAALALALPFAATAADLPKPQALFDAHIKAIGGRKAIEKESDGSITGTMEIVENGMKAEVRMASLGKNRAMTMAIPSVGEFRSGRHGDVVWSMDPMTGPRILEGKERQDQVEPFEPKYVMRDASLIESATTTALSDSEGRPCHRVEITWKSGKKTADCYGVEDKLLLSTESTVTTPMGELKQTSHFHEYKPFGPATTATVTRVKVGGMTQVISLTAYDATPPAADAVALPAAIQTLVNKAAEAKPAATEATQSQ